MTAHQGVWTLRASLVAVMAAGVLFGAAAPASAAPSEMTITNVNMDNTSLSIVPTLIAWLDASVLNDACAQRVLAPDPREGVHDVVLIGHGSTIVVHTRADLEGTGDSYSVHAREL